MNRFEKYLLVIIIVVAAFVRLWKLDSYPAFNADEAAIGYNAYSLIKTGMDEHSNPWPVHFQSFNDYKPGLYVYATLPFIAILGLTEMSVRLPNAILGIASVYVLYLLISKFTKQEKSDIGKWKFAILASLMLAINPWHIHFSRGGWEVNTATFFILTGVYFFLNYIQKTDRKNIFLSAVFLILSLYTYHAARVVAPMLAVFALFVYRKHLKKNWKTLFFAAAVSAVLLSPLILSVFKGPVYSRVSGVGIFSDPGPLLRVNEQRGQHENISGEFAQILHNKVVNYSLNFANNYFKHFHGEFLFLSGDEIQRNKVPETGQFHTFEAASIIAGLYFILRSWGKNKETDNFWKMILGWLFIAPIPAALTFQSPHALRAQNMVIPLTIISGYGLFQIINKMHNTKYMIRNTLFVSFIIFIIVFLSFARYFHMYFVHMAKEYPYSSQYGVKELVDFTQSYEGSAGKVVVTTEHDQPYILFLFYMKYLPEKFQENHELSGRDKYGFSTVEYFDRFVFKKVEWDSDKTLYRDSLIIGSPGEIPVEANIIKRIYGSNGHEYFRIVEN